MTKFHYNGTTATLVTSNSIDRDMDMIRQLNARLSDSHGVWAHIPPGTIRVHRTTIEYRPYVLADICTTA